MADRNAAIENVLTFFMNTAGPYFLDLGDEVRKNARMWVQLIRSRVEDVSLLRRYLSILAPMVIRGHLVKPFNEVPSDATILPVLPSDGMESEFVRKQLIVIGPPLPDPTIAYVSDDQTAFLSIQPVPGAGMRLYLATSSLPYTLWSIPAGATIPQITGLSSAQLSRWGLDILGQRMLDPSGISVPAPPIPLVPTIDLFPETPVHQGEPQRLPKIHDLPVPQLPKQRRYISGAPLIDLTPDAKGPHMRPLTEDEQRIEDEAWAKVKRYFDLEEYRPYWDEMVRLRKLGYEIDHIRRFINDMIRNRMQEEGNRSIPDYLMDDMVEIDEETGAVVDTNNRFTRRYEETLRRDYSITDGSFLNYLLRLANTQNGFYQALEIVRLAEESQFDPRVEELFRNNSVDDAETVRRLLYGEITVDDYNEERRKFLERIIESKSSSCPPAGKSDFQRRRSQEESRQPFLSQPSLTQQPVQLVQLETPQKPRETPQPRQIEIRAQPTLGPPVQPMQTQQPHLPVPSAPAHIPQSHPVSQDVQSYQPAQPLAQIQPTQMPSTQTAESSSRGRGELRGGLPKRGTIRGGISRGGILRGGIPRGGIPRGGISRGGIPRGGPAGRGGQATRGSLIGRGSQGGPATRGGSSSRGGTTSGKRRSSVGEALHEAAQQAQPFTTQEDFMQQPIRKPPQQQAPPSVQQQPVVQVQSSQPTAADAQQPFVTQEDFMQQPIRRLQQHQAPSSVQQQPVAQVQFSQPSVPQQASRQRSPVRAAHPVAQQPVSQPACPPSSESVSQQDRPGPSQESAQPLFVSTKPRRFTLGEEFLQPLIPGRPRPAVQMPVPTPRPPPPPPEPSVSVRLEIAEPAVEQAPLVDLAPYREPRRLRAYLDWQEGLREIEGEPPEEPVPGLADLQGIDFNQPANLSGEFQLPPELMRSPSPGFRQRYGFDMSDDLDEVAPWEREDVMLDVTDANMSLGQDDPCRPR